MTYTEIPETTLLALIKELVKEGCSFSVSANAWEGWDIEVNPVDEDREAEIADLVESYVSEF